MKNNRVTTIVLFMVLFLPCAAHTKPSLPSAMDIDKYRVYPFQWVFPEYFYKAEIIPVDSSPSTPKGYVKIDFFGLKSCLPEKYTQQIEKKNNRIIFKTLESNKRIIFSKASDRSYLCKNENASYQQDYCSSFNSASELFDKLFTLTPDTALTVGDKWIVHSKGNVFQEVKKIEIRTGDRFIAYVKFINEPFIEKRNLAYDVTLFHTYGPYSSHVVVCFPDTDEETLKHFLQGIE